MKVRANSRNTFFSLRESLVITVNADVASELTVSWLVLFMLLNSIEGYSPIDGILERQKEMVSSLE